MYLKIAQKPELKRWKHTNKKQEIEQRPKHARHKIDPTKTNTSDTKQKSPTPLQNFLIH
jgi:hypothetical protein